MRRGKRLRTVTLTMGRGEEAEDSDTDEGAEDSDTDDDREVAEERGGA